MSLLPFFGGQINFTVGIIFLSACPLLTFDMKERMDSFYGYLEKRILFKFYCIIIHIDDEWHQYAGLFHYGSNQARYPYQPCQSHIL